MNRDGLLTAASRIVSLLIAFGANALIARSLGPAAQGDYVFMISLAALVVQFGCFGLHSTNTYFAARDSLQFNSLLANSLWISLAIGGATVVAACLASGIGWSHFNSSAPLWLGVAIVPCRLFYVLASGILVGLARFKAYNVFQTLLYLSLLFGVAIVALVGGGVAGYLGASIFSWAVGCAALLVALGCKWSTLSRFDRKLLSDGMLYSAKSHVICLAGFLVLRTNVFVLQSVCGGAEVGQYSIALQFTDGLILLPAAQALVLFPALVKNDVGRWQMLCRSLRSITVLMVVICAACWLGFRPLVQAVFGPEFLPSAEIMAWMLPGVFCYGLVAIVSQYLASVGFPRPLVGIWLAAVAMTAIGSLLLAPRFGGKGAAMSFSAAYAVILVLELLVAYREEFGVNRDQAVAAAKPLLVRNEAA